MNASTPNESLNNNTVTNSSNSTVKNSPDSFYHHGLRLCSMMVCKIIMDNGTSTHNIIADTVLPLLCQASKKRKKQQNNSNDKSNVNTPTAQANDDVSDNENDGDGDDENKENCSSSKRRRVTASRSSDEKNVRRRIYDTINVLLVVVSYTAGTDGACSA